MFQTFCYHSQKVTFHWQFSPQLEHSPSPVSVEPVEEKVVDKKFHFRFSTFFFVAVCFLSNFMNLLRSRRPTHIHTHSFKRSTFTRIVGSSDRHRGGMWPSLWDGFRRFFRKGRRKWGRENMIGIVDDMGQHMLQFLRCFLPVIFPWLEIASSFFSFLQAKWHTSTLVRIHAEIVLLFLMASGWNV